MKFTKLFFILLALTFGAYLSVSASGSYNRNDNGSSSSNNSSKSQKDSAAIDKKRFQKGQMIFLGNAKLPEEVISEELKERQTERLNAWKALLPEKAAEKIDVEALAGKLKKKEMGALKYYLHKRFKVDFKEHKAS